MRRWDLSMLRCINSYTMKKEAEQPGIVWKSIKRTFSRLAASLSFAKSWIEKFIPSWI